MVKKADLKSHLDFWMTDTCNRYFHVLNDLGVIDKKKAKKLSDEILEKRNEMLNKYVPFFIDATFELLEEEEIKKHNNPINSDRATILPDRD